MKTFILIAAAGLLSSGAIAQSTMTNMGGMKTTSSTHVTKTTVRRTTTHAATTRPVVHHRYRHVVRHHHRHVVRKPMHHTVVHKKVTVETKTRM